MDLDEKTPTLPSEILLKIFHRLEPVHLHENVSLVCRQWRTVIGQYRQELGFKSKAYLTNGENGAAHCVRIHLSLIKPSIVPYSAACMGRAICESAEALTISLKLQSCTQDDPFVKPCWVMFDAFAEFRLISKTESLTTRTTAIDIHTYTKMNKEWAGKDLNVNNLMSCGLISNDSMTFEIEIMTSIPPKLKDREVLREQLEKLYQTAAVSIEQGLIPYAKQASVIAQDACGSKDALYVQKLAEQRTILFEPPATVMGPAATELTVQRVQKELAELEKDPPPFFCITAEPGDFQLQATLIGAPESIYEDGAFSVQIGIPACYPTTAPKATFTTPIYHPNVSAHGMVYLPLLFSDWSPEYTIRDVLHWLNLMLEDPCLQDPIDPELALLYVNDREEYNRRAKEWTQKDALARTDTARLRIKAELKELEEHPLPLCSSNTVENDDDLFQWRLEFPPNYPFKPPSATFTTPIYHPNVGMNGCVHLQILQQQWSLENTISDVLRAICARFVDPELGTAIRLDVAQLYENARKEYNRNAREQTKKSAMRD